MDGIRFALLGVWWNSVLFQTLWNTQTYVFG